MTPIFTALAAGISILLIIIGVEDYNREKSIVALLDDTPNTDTLPTPLRILPVARPNSYFARLLASRKHIQDKLDRKLVLADRPWGLTGQELDRITLGGLVVWPIASILIFLLLGLSLPLALVIGIVFGGLAAGFPWMVVDTQADTRKKALNRDLPQLLDLLVMADQAGATEIAGLELAAREIHGPLGEEISKVLARSVTLGGDIEAVFAQLGEDTQIEALEDFATTLAVSQRYGGSTYSQAIAAQAERIRDAHQQQIEKKIATLSTTMIIPIGVFLLPCIMLIIVGPTIPTMLHALGGGI